MKFFEKLTGAGQGVEDPKYAKAAKQQLKQNASHSRIMNFMSNVLMSLDEAVLSSSNCPPVGNDEVVIILKHKLNSSRYGGITVNSSMCVSNVKEGSDADHQGVRIGDRLVRVGETNLMSGIDGMKFSQNWIKYISEEQGRPIGTCVQNLKK